jgi:indole-3-glycerol phosphate synthase
MDILLEIAQKTKVRMKEQKKLISLAQIKDLAQLPNDEYLLNERLSDEQYANRMPFPFEIALEKATKANDIAFICEIKRASPSKGVIAKDFPYLEIAKEYEEAGAAAISVLTEPYYFKGHNDYLQEIAKEVSIPLLRKDFVVDEYMIYEAKVLGASAVLLICSILEPDILLRYIEIAHSIGISALVEVHDEEEIAMALQAGARVIGVNNRNLRTFEVDMTLSEKLKKLVPPHVLFISESGISTSEDVKRMREIGVHGVLIGESIMKAKDKAGKIYSLRGELAVHDS